MGIELLLFYFFRVYGFFIVGGEGLGGGLCVENLLELGVKSKWFMEVLG